MAFRKRYQLSDETVNSHGFWVRLAGMRLDAFKRNAPLYYDHRTWEIPIGHLEEIEVENGRLMGTVVIEGADQREKEYIRKIENGDLKGISLGLDPKQWSDDPLFLKEGQTKPTLWECEPYEASILGMPSNTNSLALRNGSSVINLSSADANTASFIPSLKPIENMKAIALKLGLKEDATEQQILDAIAGVQLSASNGRKQFVELAKQELEEDQFAHFQKLVEKDFDLATDYLKLHRKTAAPAAAAPAAAAPAAEAKTTTTVASLIKEGKQELGRNDDSKADKTCYDYLQKHNPVELTRIHKEDPAKYAKLAADYAAGVRYTA